MVFAAGKDCFVWKFKDIIVDIGRNMFSFEKRSAELLFFRKLKLYREG